MNNVEKIVEPYKKIFTINKEYKKSENAHLLIYAWGFEKIEEKYVYNNIRYNILNLLYIYKNEHKTNSILLSEFHQIMKKWAQENPEYDISKSALWRILKDIEKDYFVENLKRATTKTKEIHVRLTNFGEFMFAELKKQNPNESN